MVLVLFLWLMVRFLMLGSLFSVVVEVKLLVLFSIMLVEVL